MLYTSNESVLTSSTRACYMLDNPAAESDIFTFRFPVYLYISLHAKAVYLYAPMFYRYASAYGNAAEYRSWDANIFRNKKNVPFKQAAELMRRNICLFGKRES